MFFTLPDPVCSVYAILIIQATLQKVHFSFELVKGRVKAWFTMHCAALFARQNDAVWLTIELRLVGEHYSARGDGNLISVSLSATYYFLCLYLMHSELFCSFFRSFLRFFSHFEPF